MHYFDEPTAVRSYLKLMHEVVIRLDLVSHACNGRLNLTPPYAFEYCYLQYRRICELLALGQGLYFVSLKTESGGPACSVMSGFQDGSVTVATYNLQVNPPGNGATAA